MSDCDFETAKSTSIENRTPLLDVPAPGIRKLEDITYSPRIVSTHLALSLLPDNIVSQNKVNLRKKKQFTQNL